jgi:hypothetical protein
VSPTRISSPGLSGMGRPTGCPLRSVPLVEARSSSTARAPSTPLARWISQWPFDTFMSRTRIETPGARPSR